MNLVKQALIKKANPVKAQGLARFFKTGPGQYGAGDVFLGIILPEQRKIIKQFKDASLAEIQELLNDKIHECRLTALLILVEQYKKADEKKKRVIYNLYLKNYKNINNWDLVDLSAPKIMGEHLVLKDRKIIYEWAKSNNLWKKRIAVLATFTFIRNKDFKDIFEIAKILLNDKHDLIHKAVGWMLREAGKRDKLAEIKFLEKYAAKMPRTMLRYAIEKFSPKEREYF